MAASRIQRWSLTLGAYEYNIQYRPGSKMGNADALSRLPLPDHPIDTEIPTLGDVTQVLNHISQILWLQHPKSRLGLKRILFCLVFIFSFSMGGPPKIQFLLYNRILIATMNSVL